MSGDDSLSASQLRSRYHKGGSAPDSDLSASQLRARHGVESNSFEEKGTKISIDQRDIARESYIRTVDYCRGYGDSICIKGVYALVKLIEPVIKRSSSVWPD